MTATSPEPVEGKKKKVSSGTSPSQPQQPDPISQSIGEFGRWQLTLTFLLSFFNLPCTFHIFAPTFEAGESDFWCARPINFQGLSIAEWKNISGTTTLSPDGNVVYNPCEVKDLDYNVSLEELISQTKKDYGVRTCSSWEYDMRAYGETIISEWDLVCEKKQLSNVAEMMFLFGVALGGLASGLISDRFGRKKTLMISVVMQVILGILIAISPWYCMYIALRGILGFFSVSIVLSGFVLCMELVGGKWITISGCSYLFPLPLSYIAIAGIAYYIKGWRTLQMAITLPSICFLSLWWIIPESPRWLLAMGKIEQVMTVLEDASKFNKKKLPPNTDTLLKQSISKLDVEDPPKMGIPDLFRTPKIRKISLVLYIVWFCVYLDYYGLVLNLSNLGGDVYVNSIISGAVEFPAIAVSILFLLKMGRKWPLCLTVIGCGISCLLTIPVPLEYNWLRITFAMIGKFSISSSNVVLPVYTAELFPTVMRNLGVGSSNVASGISLMTVPYLWNMAGMNMNLPMGMLGVCGILGGLSLLLLPDTGKDGCLTETLHDLENH